MAIPPPEPADGDEDETDAADAGDAGCLPFELYAPGWRDGWGRAVHDADPRGPAR